MRLIYIKFDVMQIILLCICNHWTKASFTAILMISGPVKARIILSKNSMMIHAIAQHETAPIFHFSLLHALAVVRAYTHIHIFLFIFINYFCYFLQFYFYLFYFSSLYVFFNKYVFKGFDMCYFSTTNLGKRNYPIFSFRSLRVSFISNEFQSWSKFLCCETNRPTFTEEETWRKLTMVSTKKGISVLALIPREQCYRL